MEDFELSPHRQGRRALDDEPEDGAVSGGVRKNLFYLTVEFLHYLRREEDVPYTKGEIAREHIKRYILQRHAGELEPQENMFEAVMRPKRRKHRPTPRRPKHVLCPDGVTLDCYLSRLLSFMNLQYYKAAATLELVPAWLRFLESCKLIDGQQHAETMRDLAGLATQLLTLLKQFEPDQAVRSTCARAWSQ
jgi:hypothetical protein